MTDKKLKDIEAIKDFLAHINQELNKLVLFREGTEILFEMEVKSGSAANELAEEELV